MFYKKNFKENYSQKKIPEILHRVRNDCIFDYFTDNIKTQTASKNMKQLCIWYTPVQSHHI